MNSFKFSFLFLFFLSCLVSSAEKWDLSWLLDVDPSSLTEADMLNRAIELDNEYQRWHQVNGIIWTREYLKLEDQEPTFYGNGGDSAIFTGFYLAAATYRFMLTRAEKDLDIILETLRGVHILTHISGVPGVLARNAFPKEKAALWKYPESWAHRKYVYESSDNIPDILNEGKTYPKMIFYCRTSRDQLTGIIFGLAVALSNLRKINELDAFQGKLKKALDITAEISLHLYKRIRHKDFKIKDHRNKAGSSNNVSGILKTALYALYKETLVYMGLGASKAYKRAKDHFKSTFKWVMRYEGLEYRLSKIAGGYFSWNLRASRAFSIWTLDESISRRRDMQKFFDRRIWDSIKRHQNSHFTFIFNVIREGRHTRLEDGILSLKRFYFRPMRSFSSPLHDQEKRPSWLERFTGKEKDYVVPAHLRKFSRYFLWQKDPYSVGEGIDKIGVQRSPGLSYLLPYWMGKYYNLF